MTNARFTFRRDGTVEYDGVKIGRADCGATRVLGTKRFKFCYAAFDT